MSGGWCGWVDVRWGACGGEVGVSGLGMGGASGVAEGVAGCR